jgi:polyhydroxyalkanoate synthesis regulator phasin
MERGTKVKIGAGALAAFVLAVGLGAGGALAVADAVSDDDDASEVAAVDATVDSDDPSESLTEALEFLVDEAVEAGRLTEEEGDELKESLRSGELPNPFPRLENDLFPDRDFDFFATPDGLGDYLFGPVDLDAAASYLGLTRAELDEERDDGKSLAEIAREQGKSVDGLVQALTNAAEERIDGAVDEGRLSEERAADLKEGLEERIRDRVDDEPGEFSFKFDFQNGPDFDFPSELEPRSFDG